MLVAVVIVVATLLIFNVSYDDYFTGAQYISFLLGPATVALALPLYRQATNIRQAGWTVAACLITGSVTAVVVAIVVTKSLGGSDALALSMAPKSTTTPVSHCVGGVGRRDRFADGCLHHPDRHPRRRRRAAAAHRAAGA